MLARKALAGTAGAPKVYVEDVFSTYLYTGTGATNTISNNIDLSGEGGLVWIKRRTGTESHSLYDTNRGNQLRVYSDLTSDNANTGNDALSSFNSNGFTVNQSGYAVNDTNLTHVSWTFRKAEKFFDVVTYTGNGVAGRQIAHSLGSAPGCIIVKCTNIARDWAVWHRTLADTTYLKLNTTDSVITNNTFNVFGDASGQTSSVFTVGKSGSSGVNGLTNANGDTYVAYLFAHDAGGFGDAGSDNVISCGSFNSTSAVSLGWEPQWILFKRSDDIGNWTLVDSMRGLPGRFASAQRLRPNTSDAEGTDGILYISPTGFVPEGHAGGTYIYIAIRRGPMKTPETGTSVYENVAYTGDGTTQRQIGSSVMMDMVLLSDRDATSEGWTTSYGHYIYDRLRGDNVTLATSKTTAETSGWQTYFDSDVQVGWDTSSVANQIYLNKSSTKYVSHIFRRAPGFFDVVCYTGNGTSSTNYSHNLGAVPEIAIIKRRDTTGEWWVCRMNATTIDTAQLQSTAAFTLGTSYGGSSIMKAAPTSSVINLGNYADVNASGGTYVAYLFASLSGVSKIGTYTGNGSSVTVTTNFQPRFILVKRTDSTGDWIVSDSARGLVAGNDPYLELNTTDAEVTNEDWVDISSTSFTVNQTTNNANVNTGTYLYLAIS